MGSKLTFVRGEGGVPKSLPGEDHISGMLLYMPDGESLPSPETGVDGFTADNPIKAISTTDMAKSMGIKPDATNWYHRVLYYHISEALAINPGISLYVGIYNEPSDPTTTPPDFTELITLADYAGGRIRQVAMYRPSVEAATEDITTIQGVCETLRSQAKPLSVLYAANVSDVSSLAVLRSAGNNYVSAVISQDGSGQGKDLYSDADNTNTESVTNIGEVLGMVSLASVHECIGWVQKFKSRIIEPALADGTLNRNAGSTVLEQLDSDGFLFLVTYPGISGCYMNDSHTLDEATSDYSTIEANRVMDKAERGIRVYLSPYLGAPIYVDAESGKLRTDTVKFLETLAGKQLEDMEADGELSGYKVEVDPEQDVLSTSTVEFVIKQVQVGVMRRMNVKIGYTTKIE